MKIFWPQLSKLALSNFALQRHRKWFVLLVPQAPGQSLENVRGTDSALFPWDSRG
jgi:hypothetical protein